MNDSVPFVHWRTIKFGDTDAASIVYTTRFTDYCMDAAEVWFKEIIDIDWYQINIHQNMGTPVVHMELDFTDSLIGGDRLGVVVRVGKVTRSTVTLEFEGIRVREGSDEETQCFTAKFIHCFFTNKTESAMPIPDEQRKLLDKYINACSNHD